MPRPQKRHRLAAVLRRKGFQHHRLRKRLQRAAGRALHNAEEDQQRQVRREPQRNEAAVKPNTAAISSRLRPK